MTFARSLLYNSDMSPKPLKIFLSYSSNDRPQVEKIYSFLHTQGADVWYDQEKLLPGQDWNYEIHKGLDEADVILLCLSKKSVSKEGYVQKEMRLALDMALEMPEGRIFLIPARLEECDLPYKLKSYQWVDLFADNGMDRLIKSLNLRASQVNANPLSADGKPAPAIKKPAPKKRKSNPKPSGGNIINIHGNVSGSNIVIGDDNQVDN
jgi:hypothetical protein